MENSKANETGSEAKLPDFNRLWDYAHPDETERKFRELLPAAQASGDESYWLQLGTQIARAMGLQGKFRECHSLLDEIQAKLTDELPVAKVRYLLERGRAFNSEGAQALALEHFADAWEFGESTGQYNFAIDAVHMLAISESDRSKQAEWGEQGLRLVAAHPGNERWLPPLYNNLGETYRALQKYEKALECFERMAEADRNAGRQADMYTTKDIAKMNRLLGRNARALEVIEPIAMELESKDARDGYICAEYGECLLVNGRESEAWPYLVEGYRILSSDPYMTKYEPEELARLKRLAGESS